MRYSDLKFYEISPTWIEVCSNFSPRWYKIFYSSHKTLPRAFRQLEGVSHQQVILVTENSLHQNMISDKYFTSNSPRDVPRAKLFKPRVNQPRHASPAGPYTSVHSSAIYSTSSACASQLLLTDTFKKSVKGMANLRGAKEMLSRPLLGFFFPIYVIGDPLDVAQVTTVLQGAQTST